MPNTQVNIHPYIVVKKYVVFQNYLVQSYIRAGNGRRCMQLDSRGFLRKNKFLHSSEKMVLGKDFEITCTSFRRKEEILQLAANNCLPFIHFLFIFALSQVDSMKKRRIIECVFFGRLIFLILIWMMRHLFLSTQPTKPGQLHNL